MIIYLHILYLFSNNMQLDFYSLIIVYSSVKVSRRLTGIKIFLKNTASKERKLGKLSRNLLVHFNISYIWFAYS